MRSARRGIPKAMPVEAMAEPEYKVMLDNYSGPLDLLLYLIRRDELDIADIPVARVTEQYVRHLDLMKDLNINVAGEFLVMAATLMEIKSRMLLPEPPPNEDEEMADPRAELVQQLMAYRRFKEAARALEGQAEARAQRYARAGERPAEDPKAGERTGLTGVGLWQLLEAFSAIVSQVQPTDEHVVALDDIPVEECIRRVAALVRERGRMRFEELFGGNITRAYLIAMFLALLELVKQGRLRAEQPEAFGEIMISYQEPDGEGVSGGSGEDELGSSGPP